MSTSTLTPVESSPSSADSLWSLATLMRPDWERPIVVRSSFQTSVDHGLSGAEQRRALRGRPRRSVEFSAQATGHEEVLKLKMLAARGGIARSLVPLWPDISIVTADAASGQKTVSCDTSQRRFAASSRVVIYRDSSDGEAPEFEVVEVDSLTASALTSATNLSRTYKAGRSFVVPLIEADLRIEVEGEAPTDRTLTAQVEAVETTGATQLPALTDTGSTPSGFSSHGGLPILDLGSDFSDGVAWSSSRLGGLSSSGIDSVPEVHGDRPRVSHELSFLSRTRAEAMDVVRFFESRGGRLEPFWLPSPSSDYVFEQFINSGGGVRVKALGAEGDWDLRPYLAVVEKDGTVTIRGVSSVSRSGGSDDVTFDSAIGSPPAASDIDRVCIAYKCRLARDEMVETWHTDRVMRTGLRPIETLEEKTVTISDLAKITTAALAVTFSAGSCSGTASTEIIDQDFQDYADDGDTGDLYTVSTNRETAQKQDGHWEVYEWDGSQYVTAATPNLIVTADGRVEMDSSRLEGGNDGNDVRYIAVWHPSSDYDFSQPYTVKALLKTTDTPASQGETYAPRSFFWIESWEDDGTTPPPANRSDSKLEFKINNHGKITIDSGGDYHEIYTVSRDGAGNAHGSNTAESAEGETSTENWVELDVDQPSVQPAYDGTLATGSLSSLSVTLVPKRWFGFTVQESNMKASDDPFYIKKFQVLKQ